MKIRYSYMAIMLVTLLWGTSCTEDFPAQSLTDEQMKGLVLQLQVEGSPRASRVSLESESALNEDKVNAVDVFFVPNGGTSIKYVHASTPDTQGRFLLAGGDWRSQFTNAPYTVYVLANKHNYDNPATPETETDLSWITTVDQLQSLTDTDGEIYKIEGDNDYKGKQFFMDGKTEWTPSATGESDETIEVTLKRAAAKIVVNISYAEDFMTSNQIEDLNKVQKAVVNYAPHAMALEETAYQEMEVRGEASMETETFSNAHSTSGEGVARKDVVYAYSYPNQWGENMERETYVLLNIPYFKEAQEGQNPYHTNYYKVPIRFSNNADELCLDRNKLYTVNVTIDRLGNENIDEPVTLKPTFNVADWISEEIPVDDNTPSYLVLSHEYIEMHNVADTTITFFSSDKLQSVEIIDAYFINKEGKETRKQLIKEAEKWWEEDESKNVKDFCTVDWDENTLQGSIKFHGDIPTNVTARYVTLRVTSSDPDLKPNYKEVTIVQYPLEYISGVPGVYSTRSDFENNTYENYLASQRGNRFRSLTVSTGDNTPYFDSKVIENGVIYAVIRAGNRNNYYLSHERNAYSEEQNNNRMYLVQITSTSDNYTIARPKLVNDNDGEFITDSGDENNQLVSPAFMLASQLGTIMLSSYTSGASWAWAKEHCKNYVEVVRYEDGSNETRTLSDWRLPTRAELDVIASRQKQYPEVLAEVLVGQYYWSADSESAYEVDNPSSPGSQRSIRCIRDVSPEDLAEFRKHNIR